MMRNLHLLAYAALILHIVVFAGCAKKGVKPVSFDPEAAYTKANKFMEEKKFEEARKLLNEVKGKDAMGVYGPLAALRIGDSYLREDESDLAVEEFRAFLELYPDYKFAPYAQYQIAMVYYGQIEDMERGYAAAVKALAEFETLMRKHPRNPYGEDVAPKMQGCRDIMADYEFMVGNFYFKEKAYKGALGRLLGLLEQFPEYKKEADALYRIAVSYRELGDGEKADGYMKLMSEKYPESKALEEAKKAFAAPKESDK